MAASPQQRPKKTNTTFAYIQITGGRVIGSSLSSCFNCWVIQLRFANCRVVHCIKASKMDLTPPTPEQCLYHDIKPIKKTNSSGTKPSCHSKEKEKTWEIIFDRPTPLCNPPLIIFWKMNALKWLYCPPSSGNRGELKQGTQDCHRPVVQGIPSPKGYRYTSWYRESWARSEYGFGW